MIDIVQFLNTQEPVASWTTAKKQALLGRFCKARGYTEQYVLDENGEPTAELIQTKKDFMNEDILNYIKIMFRADSEREAKESLTVDEISFEV